LSVAARHDGARATKPDVVDDLRVLRDAADTVNEVCRICKKPVVHY
jgi:hypothetical protein